MVNSHNRVHVIDYAPCVRWQHLRVDCPAGSGIDNLSLGSLGIFGLKRLHTDTRLVLGQLLQYFHTVRFIVLHRKDAPGIGKKLQGNFQSLYKFLRLFYYPPVIGRQIWLTLCTVGNHIIDFLRLFGRKLDKSREPGTAHSHNPGFFNPLNNLFPAHLFRRLQPRIPHLFVQPVILDNNAHHIVTGNHPSRLNCLDRAGHCGINRCGHKTSCLRNLLACQYTLSLLHNRFRRRANMLRQRINQISLGKHSFNRLILGQFLAVIRMDTALEC